MEGKHLTAEQRAARAKNTQRLAAEIIELAAHLSTSNKRLLQLIEELECAKGVPPLHEPQSK